MDNKRYISVILPLKLEWEPCYSLPSDTEVVCGDRVKVGFAGRVYTAVVSSTDISPETDESRIKDILSLEGNLGRITPGEMELWKKVSDYYMCSIGEVYKAAYPSGKTGMEEAGAISRQKAAEREHIRTGKIIGKILEKTKKLQQRAERYSELASKSRKDSTRASYVQIAENALKEIQELEGRLEEINGNCRRGEDTGQVRERVSLSFTPSQAEALSRINKAFEAKKPVLLHGVTGSGKTEIYMEIAQEMIGREKNVLYLVPEIALSRQLEERLRRVFGDRLLTFHSGESPASRRDTAETIRSGQGYIVLGTRSSLFLPHHDLGLIIVDEEHDSSYKQDSPAPRYNGRDTALILAGIHDCRIILGSATPSLEELYNCQAGRHMLVELNERYYGSDDATIEIIDTKAERKKNGMTGNFSRRLISHISKALSEGGQILILRSRRAWSPVLQCEQCGDIPKCPHCNVSLSLHNDGSLRCHYCGARFNYTGRCAKCGGQTKALGAGTQRIEEEASALFPNARITRLDSDTAQNRNFEKTAIRDFSEGKTDIMIGTQMVSKGFDFSRLTLVAVIAADSLLGIQDFRADERAYQMLEQLRGRCGRRKQNGMFVIQTANPEHPVYQNIISNNKLFSSTLLSERRDFRFPPYTRIIEISLKDRYADRLERMAALLANEIRAGRPASEGLLDDPVSGPYTPAVDKVADLYIRNIRISLKKDRQLISGKAALKETINRFEKKMKYDGHITINVDPS